MAFMTTETKLRIYKRDGKEVQYIGGGEEAEPKKNVLVRNVWNSRDLVEIEIDGVKLEVAGGDFVQAIENALSTARRS